MEFLDPPRNRKNDNSIEKSTMRNGIELSIDLKRMLEENALVVFTIKGCCMGLVVKRLLQTVGSNPNVYELDEEEQNGVAVQLHRRGLEEDCFDRHYPAVFIGGRWFGGLDRIIAAHISGELIPSLKQVGALWL